MRQNRAVTTAPDNAAPTHKGSILVLDDDRLVLATVVHGLTQAGYAVLDADNGDDAILLTRDHRPDLALLDIRMEGKSGFDVAAYLRDVPRVPFVFFSAFADDETRAKAKALGALDYWVKPMDVARLVPYIDAAMARAKTMSSAPTPSLRDTPAPGVGINSTSPSPLVSVAVGIVMHRYSLSRVAALERLHRLATEQRLTLVEQAERLVLAVEELARSSN